TRLQSRGWCARATRSDPSYRWRWSRRRRARACDIERSPPTRGDCLADPPSSSPPTSARAVVIGAGIVGNSIVHHLAEMEWSELVLIDKGPLPDPGGSTGHASNFIFPVDHSREITELTLASMQQYKELRPLT